MTFHFLDLRTEELSPPHATIDLAKAAAEEHFAGVEHRWDSDPAAGFDHDGAVAALFIRDDDYASGVRVAEVVERDEVVS